MLVAGINPVLSFVRQIREFPAEDPLWQRSTKSYWKSA